MKPIGIVTDSHSSITPRQAEELGILVLPMPFYFGEECFYENRDLSREAFFEKLEAGVPVTTSQPGLQEVMDIWDEALKEYEKILYIPISSGLSGSCQVAMAMAEDEPYHGRVLVVDNGRVSTPLHRSILDALELIEEGYSAEEIKQILEENKARMVIYIGVETLEHLKKGGRITPAAAMLGNVLNIKPILKLSVGKLDSFKKCRGFAKARKTMIEAVREDLENQFKEEYQNGELYLMAASSASEEETRQWVEEIEEAFPGMEVMCDNLSLGVCCHIGRGGLGIGLSCRPRRVQRRAV